MFSCPHVLADGKQHIQIMKDARVLLNSATYTVSMPQLHNITITSSFCTTVVAWSAVGWVAERASGLYKIEWWVLAWLSWLWLCLERGADLHMAQLMPLPLNVSCFSKIQTGFTFLVLAHPSVHVCLHNCCTQYSTDQF